MTSSNQAFQLLRREYVNNRELWDDERMAFVLAEHTLYLMTAATMETAPKRKVIICPHCGNRDESTLVFSFIRYECNYAIDGIRY